MNDVHEHILQLSVLRIKDGNDLHMYSTNTRKRFLFSSNIFSKPYFLPVWCNLHHNRKQSGAVR